MGMDRRELILGAAGAVGLAAASPAGAAGSSARYGLIGRMTARPGKRDALAALLLEGLSELPGCLSYVVALDPADPDRLWITEVWASRQAHAASLSLPSVKAAIARGRPMIAEMESIAETVPIGGHGLAP